MSLNESIADAAALTWLAELGHAAGHGPHLAPGEPAAERRIVMLHQFVKKSEKTPKKEIKIARNRMKEIKDD